LLFILAILRIWQFFNLNVVITNTIDDVRVNILKKGRQGDRIKLVYQPSDIFVEADKVRIAQVIHNILDNAVKFSIADVSKEQRIAIINIDVDKIDEPFINQEILFSKGLYAKIFVLILILILNWTPLPFVLPSEIICL